MLSNSVGVVQTLLTDNIQQALFREEKIWKLIIFSANEET